MSSGFETVLIGIVRLKLLFGLKTVLIAVEVDVVGGKVVVEQM